MTESPSLPSEPTSTCRRGSLRWVVAHVLGYGGCCCSAAAPLLGRRRMFLISLGVLWSLRPWRAGQRRGAAADRDPLHQGRERGLHRTGPALDHHHQLCRGPPQQAWRSTGHRCHRLLARARVRRPAHRAGLALGVPVPVPLALITLIVAIRLVPDPGHLHERQLRRGRRDSRHGRNAAARVHRRGGTRGGLDLGPDARLTRRRRARSSARSSCTSAGPPRRSCGWASCARARWCGPTSGDVAHRGVVRVPVHRDAVHAAAARLVGARTGLALFPAGVLVAILATRSRR